MYILASTLIIHSFIIIIITCITTTTTSPPPPAAAVPQMVTTFNDRIINLRKTVAPLVGKPSALLSSDPSNRSKDASSTGIMKRHAPSASARKPFYYTPSARQMSAADAKRRRLKDELHYTAATIQQALENAGRPPLSRLTCRVRALPSSVNTEGCMVMSSADYDASTAPATAVKAAADADDANDKQDGQTDVDEMLAYASLIQCTRHCYRFVDTASLATPTESNNNDEDDGKDNGDDDDDDEETRASSDTTSTWAPTSICNQVNLNDKKAIDNENRSDGTSSNPASSAYGEEETSDISFSDQCEGAESSPSPLVPEKEEGRSLNGNLFDYENNGNHDLRNNGNGDNAEDNNIGRRNSDPTAPEGAYFAVG
jgi:hypothetical protein